ncbi:anaphase-promoting complex subunit Cut9 [Coemansia nantahalensis]|uniref:Anaphase-promoting complex subunit Cut9 n=1 Tax=Coemansia nantahalensis TaxID=2789366 RepID=A0ACC1K7D0_9FUNG|nr:anaphase-promoting complex subunit Cut9 [Coemansia nantahalensis]
MSGLPEVVAHLRGLRASCARGLAWCSALVWAEKALLLSGDTDDLLWLADALVTNGQYRQAEELLVGPAHIAKVRASAAGRYLASVVAMRLGRAEDALELLRVDMARPGSGRAQLGDRAGPPTPTAKKGPAGGDGGAAAAVRLPLPLLGGPAATVAAAGTLGEAEVPALNARAWMLYMQGAAVIQLCNVGASEATASIKQLSAQYPRAEADPWRLGTPHTGPASDKPAAESPLGGMDALVGRIWAEAVQVDARCWEAWTGLRGYGLLTGAEEAALIQSVDWTACCGGSKVAGQFFRDYCLATQTSFALSDAAIDATGRLLARYPALAGDPALRTIQAARLLSLGRARECLEYTVGVLEHRRVPDPSATAIHITALAVLHAKDALFRIAHELAEEFGLSAVKRAEIEPGDTGSALAPAMATAAAAAGAAPDRGSARLSTGGPGSTPLGSAVGAAVAGSGRLRAGARGLLVPETPSIVGSGLAGAGGSVHRQALSGAAAHAIARSVVQSAPAAAAAAWRGLWGLPTWTQPGPPVLATYPSALGPAQGPLVSTDASMSTVGTFTTSGAQCVGGPTQYEFTGASLAWYAIGCYYLVSASLLALPDAARREWALGGALYAGVGSAPATALRRAEPLTPEAEHALAEARRWLAKTTLASPRSITAWIAFAQTFVVAGEWESATRALHTAVGLCGCEGVVHAGGRDAGVPALPLHTPSKQPAQLDHDLLADEPRAAARDAAGFERGSQLAHAPLAILGSVYLHTGELAMAESCLDASARCLGGYRIRDWLAAWGPTLDVVQNSHALDWCAAAQSQPTGPVQLAAVADPQLLNDAGVLFYSSGRLADARRLFMLALAALNGCGAKQHTLRAAFSPAASRPSASATPAPEVQAYAALFKANLGNTLRRLGDYDAALVCLESAAADAPGDDDIALATAFALHSRAIETYAQAPDACDADLDRAVDMYHQILAARPGDATATDLLSLALELSVSTKDIFHLHDPLGLGAALDARDDPFALRSPDEIGLALPAAAAAPSEHGSQATPRTPDAGSSPAEDSDDVMEIDDDDDSGSDMAME